MQNSLENGRYLYLESTDDSGFILREMIGTKNPKMQFQAGKYVSLPMSIPVYTNDILTHHRIGDSIQKFGMLGYGRTAKEALTIAADKLIRAEINGKEIQFA